MDKYVTIVNYIDTDTGEIVNKKELGNRNFREEKEDQLIIKENGKYTKIIQHYGTLGSEGKGDSQLRLL